jgi:1-acyl-sn-glycerol-3-phosphate acyltransferase
MTIAMAGGRSTRKPGGKTGGTPKGRRPALGNDPFERGAAVREPEVGKPERPSTSPALSGGAEPTPDSVRPERGEVLSPSKDRAESKGRGTLAALEAEGKLALARLLPALNERLGSVAELVRLLAPAERLDRFGMDARFAERLATVVEFFYSTWWRVQVRGIDAVPAHGPALVVANHGGIVPWDAFVLRHALRRDHPAHRELRPLLDERECELPVIGAAALRAGAVRASAELADRVLAAGEVLGVFPEGSAGARKPWRDRYTLVQFGRGGFVKVALRAGAPIVPCAIVGSEEASAGISRTGWLAERLGVPLLAGNAALRLARAAFLPLPSRWSLRFGEPIEVASHPPAAADDPAVVNALAERVRAAIQAMLDEDVASRTSVFL